MKRICCLLLCFTAISQGAYSQEARNDYFPDGTKISGWFLDTTKVELSDLGKAYLITDYGVVNDNLVVQTKAIQEVIDAAARQGGGVVVVPKGVYMSGALFFKPGTSLYLSEGATLKGSSRISDYPMRPSRIEGQSIDYYPALVNAYGVDGFTILGKGTIDGNGLGYWNAFWERRKQNPSCTNLEVSRPRLVFIWNCRNVRLQDVMLVNSGFWTSHFYKCSNVKMVDLRILSPAAPVKAPSTDAIDIDACTNFWVKRCYMSVNDDAIALKGGKGPWADRDTCNGPNANIIIEDCTFGYCHSALTCGSESIHSKNVLMRNCSVNGCERLLWLKMRPDTPQRYEHITVENIQGHVGSFLYAKPWTQFFDLNGRKDVPLSFCDSIILRNIRLKCNVLFDVGVNKNTHLSNFIFQHVDAEAANGSIDKRLIKGITLDDVKVNGALLR
ncbi:glycosyl hydrolase family 28 protein [uncultured Acetobacteroides sp.]|uniref:rhamnogalacturonidase n=1 Tax=uncultured Acetobacteroides sp. TaxID=1760811 RepID=UPI0029F57641|nr:glycosyl hydrolase family 28 protein [uncultured Acetobacteroides sp.]